MERYIPTAVSLLCGVYGAVPPAAETRQTSNILVGATKRFINKNVEPDAATLFRFKKFVTSWIHSNLTPLTEVPDYKKWLMRPGIPDWKRAAIDKDYQSYLKQKNMIDALLQSFILKSKTSSLARMPPALARVCGIGNFAKLEHYPSVKPSRNINARRNAYKGIVGPYYAAIEKQVYQNPWFIKHTPVDKRPAVISQDIVVPGWRYFSTDYSSFEGSFCEKVQDSCEMILYDYMLSKIGGPLDWIHIQNKTNCVEGKNFKMYTQASRMSGEMCTSLGNGFTNMMLMKFACHEARLPVKGKIEGDDGLFSCPSVPPTDSITKLGFKLKMLEVPVNEASFCGQIFDLDTKTVIADPYYSLATSGFSFNCVGASERTKHTIMGAKGLSMMFQYKGCPLLWSWGDRMFRTSLKYTGLTPAQQRECIRNYYMKSNRVNEWDRAQMLEAVDGDLSPLINMSTRETFERLYHISVQHQQELENLFQSGTGWFYNTGYLECLANYRAINLDGTIADNRCWISEWQKLQNVQCNQNSTPKELALQQTQFAKGFEDAKELRALCIPQAERDDFIYDNDFPHPLQLT